MSELNSMRGYFGIVCNRLERALSHMCLMPLTLNEFGKSFSTRSPSESLTSSATEPLASCPSLEWRVTTAPCGTSSSMDSTEKPLPDPDPTACRHALGIQLVSMLARDTDGSLLPITSQETSHPNSFKSTWTASANLSSVPLITKQGVSLTVYLNRNWTECLSPLSTSRIYADTERHKKNAKVWITSLRRLDRLGYKSRCHSISEDFLAFFRYLSPEPRSRLEHLICEPLQWLLGCKLWLWLWLQNKCPHLPWSQSHLRQSISQNLKLIETCSVMTRNPFPYWLKAKCGPLFHIVHPHHHPLRTWNSAALGPACHVRASDKSIAWEMLLGQTADGSGNWYPYSTEKW